ncbi:MAG: hypothetical protein AAFQ82_11285 [Myxococcota bacterium]
MSSLSLLLLSAPGWASTEQAVALWYEESVSCLSAQHELEAFTEAGLLRVLADRDYADIVEAAGPSRALRDRTCDAAEERRRTLVERLNAAASSTHELEIASSILQASMELASIELLLESQEGSSSRLEALPDPYTGGAFLQHLLAVLEGDEEQAVFYLHQIVLDWHTRSAFEAGRLASALGDAVGEVAAMLSPETAQRFPVLVGQLLINGFDVLKYESPLNSIERFVAEHEESFDSLDPLNLLELRAYFLNPVSGHLQVVNTGAESCNSRGKIIDTVLGRNPAAGSGACSMARMTSACLVGVGPSCPDEMCDENEEDGFSRKFSGYASRLRDSERETSSSACRGEAGKFGNGGSGVGGGTAGGQGVGGGSGGVFGAAVTGGGTCLAEVFSDAVSSAGAKAQACVDHLVGKRNQSLLGGLTPHGGVQRDECRTDPIAQGGVPSIDVSCVVGQNCFSKEEQKEYFGSDEWKAKRQKIGEMVRAVEGIDVEDDSWKAGEQAATKGRFVANPPCRSSDALGCARKTKSGKYKVYYDGSKAHTKESANETSGHEAGHVALDHARSKKKNRGKNSACSSSACQTALDHLYARESGEQGSDAQYQEEKKKLSDSERKYLDEAERKLKDLKEKKAAEENSSSPSSGNSMPACQGDGGCDHTCSPAIRDAMETMDKCSMRAESSAEVDPLDPYILPDPDDADETAFGACMRNEALARANLAKSCGTILCEAGGNQTSCSGGMGCCCGDSAMVTLPPDLSRTCHVMLCQDPSTGSASYGVAGELGECGCGTSASGTPTIPMPAKDPSVFFQYGLFNQNVVDALESGASIEPGAGHSDTYRY